MITALNFAILPLKLDITEVLVYFSSKTIGIPKKQMITTKKKFKTKKTNQPKDQTTHIGMREFFLGSVKSDIVDPRNRNEAKCNLPKEEVSALSERIRLQIKVTTKLITRRWMILN